VTVAKEIELENMGAQGLLSISRERDYFPSGWQSRVPDSQMSCLLRNALWFTRLDLVRANYWMMQMVAQTLPFIRRSSVFTPDVTLAMGDAYDRAIGTLQPDAESQFVVRELIAKRIIKIAQKGIVDRDQLCASAAQTTILFGVSALDRA
jgi:hypothetical protein